MDEKTLTKTFAKTLKLEKMNKRLIKASNSLALLTITAAAYFALINIQCAKQHEETLKILNDIKELEKAKGE